MHISTNALSVILLSFIGRSQTALTKPYEDAFGITKYGFKCEDRVYTKPIIFAAAKNFCDTSFRAPTFSHTGVRGTFEYMNINNPEASKMLDLDYNYEPVFADGTLYFHGSYSGKKLPGKNERTVPGPDRLVIDRHGNIKGAFIDHDYLTDTDTPRVEDCMVLNSEEDIKIPVQSPGTPPQRSRENSPERSREIPPERILQMNPQRSGEQTSG